MLALTALSPYLQTMHSAWGGREVVWFALLSLPSRNSSNKCTFHTKVSLIVLLSLDSPSVDWKLRSLWSQSHPNCKCSAVKVASNWVPVCSYVAAAHVPLPIVKLASIYLSWGLRFIRERESTSVS